MPTRSTFAVAAGLVLLAGCGKHPEPPPLPPPPDCVAGEVRCTGTTLERCSPAGSWVVGEECGARFCSAELGCHDCAPGARVCAGADVRECDATGAFTTIATCREELGERCAGATCRTACELASDTRSYIGCVYHPTVTPNFLSDRAAALSAFSFAVVVANPGTIVAHVVVDRARVVVAEVDVPAGEMRTIELPWVEELVRVNADSLARGAGYRLISSQPVVAYQFNPLEFEADGLYSYSNDASLLLPSPTLGTDYLVAMQPPMLWNTGGIDFPGGRNWPAVASVQGAEDDTAVTVRFSAHVDVWDGATRTRYAPGEEATFELDATDVLQLMTAPFGRGAAAECRMTEPEPSAYEVCRPSADYDLTGTRITSTKRVAVFVSTPCAYVPFEREACDHLEEQLYPVGTWGTRVAAVPTPTYGPTSGLGNRYRIVSAVDGNAVTFDPPSVAAPTTLGAGDALDIEAAEAFVVAGSGALAVLQLMVSSGVNELASGMVGQGDPAMAMLAPTDQFRSDYTFLTPTTYTTQHVTLVAPTGTTPTVDGEGVGALTPIGASGLGWTRVELAPGPHRATVAGGAGFGIVVSGVARYTSYLFAGGLDLEPLF